jgi:hypothetical protein
MTLPGERFRLFSGSGAGRAAALLWERLAHLSPPPFPTLPPVRVKVLRHHPEGHAGAIPGHGRARGYQRHGPQPCEHVSIIKPLPCLYHGDGLKRSPPQLESSPARSHPCRPFRLSPFSLPPCSLALVFGLEAKKEASQSHGLPLSPPPPCHFGSRSSVLFWSSCFLILPMRWIPPPLHPRLLRWLHGEQHVQQNRFPVRDCGGWKRDGESFRSRGGHAGTTVREEPRDRRVGGFLYTAGRLGSFRSPRNLTHQTPAGWHASPRHAQGRPVAPMLKPCSPRRLTACRRAVARLSPTWLS